MCPSSSKVTVMGLGGRVRVHALIMRSLRPSGNSSRKAETALQGIARCSARERLDSSNRLLIKSFLTRGLMGITGENESLFVLRCHRDIRQQRLRKVGAYICSNSVLYQGFITTLNCILNGILQRRSWNSVLVNGLKKTACMQTTLLPEPFRSGNKPTASHLAVGLGAPVGV